MNGADSHAPHGWKQRDHFRHTAGGRVQHVAWSPDGYDLAAGFEKDPALVWRIGGLEPRLRLGGHGGSVIQVAWSPDGQVLATASKERGIHLWQAGTGDLLGRIDTRAELLVGFAWSEDGRCLTAALIQGKQPDQRLVLQTWDSRSHELLGSVHQADWDLAYVGTSADKCLLGLSLTNNRLHVWDLGRVEKIADLDEKRCAIGGVALSPDGSLLAVSLDDGRVSFWESKLWQLVQICHLHDKCAFSICFSADSRFLASKAGDGTVRLRDCKTWEEVSRLNEPSGREEGPELSFHPALSRIVSFHEGATMIRVWDIDFKAIDVAGGGTVKNILFLAADPTDSSIYRLRLDEELREIQECLQRSGMRERLELHVQMALRPNDLSRVLLQQRPSVVHFSGHGGQSGEIFVEGPSGGKHAIDAETLGALFERVNDSVRCVLLNACLSEPQAEAIGRSIPYVIGMKANIEDQAAIAFSRGFYQALGEGRSFEEAYHWGCIEIRLWKIPGHLTPVLIHTEAASKEVPEDSKRGRA